jgi:hypothetical protein
VAAAAKSSPNDARRCLGSGYVLFFFLRIFFIQTNDFEGTRRAKVGGGNEIEPK